MAKQNGSRQSHRVVSAGAEVDAIEAVYRSRATDFFRFAFARTSDPEAARDAVQEGFARAIRSRATYRGDGSLESWIVRCVLNAVEDGRRPAGELESEVEASDEGRSATEREANDVIRAAIRELPPRQRDALFLRFYLDLDYASIAEILAIELGTVSATLHAARSNLSRTLEEVPQ
jgi:RNA polymerase sigma factor (sigma-70 family)